MVTTTTPRFASLVPSYSAAVPEPLFSPPPWIQNTTGSGSSASAGAHTFRVRQSSLIGSGPTPLSPLAGGWMQIAPREPASRGVDQGSGGAGGRQRRSPTGGAA